MKIADHLTANFGVVASCGMSESDKFGDHSHWNNEDLFLMTSQPTSCNHKLYKLYGLYEFMGGNSHGNSHHCHVWLQVEK